MAKILIVKNCFDCPAHAVLYNVNGLRQVFCCHRGVTDTRLKVADFPFGAAIPSLPDFCPLEDDNE